MESGSDNLADYLKALGDPSRLKILALLIDREASVEELAAALNLKTPTISHHLTRLKALELVDMRAEGTTHLYRFKAETLHQLTQALEPESLKKSAPASDDAWASKVLRDFLNGQMLKEIPASRKKRFVILQWLAGKFESGVRYPEAEVNQILSVHHPDFATLRRELIASRLMERESGVYWLIDSEHA